MGVEGHALLLYFPKACQGKHLKSAGVREDRPLPVHKAMKASARAHDLVARTHMQMIRVAQFHLRSDTLEIR